MEIKLDSCTVKFNDDVDMKNRVFNKLMEWYKEHESFTGESILQSDATIISAPELLAEIADDIIKFDVEWED